ncbi:MAG: DUF302 domain-containing protein [Myxococcales bacterium]|nr:DUF302 domain-containing protein [Myxococcales bacterium]
MSTPAFGLQKKLELDFDAALTAVPEALSGEGFGVLTEIDVRATLEKKLGVSTRPYRILGACNPPFAHRALGIDLRAGLLMPCNVVVYEADDGRAMVHAIDPTQSVGSLGNAELTGLAQELREKLERVLAKL